MDRLIADARFALRGFRRTPGFFITAVAILGIGIGMSVAMFTVFRTVLVRKLPVVDQDRVVVMWTYRTDPNSDYVSGTKDLSVVRRDARTMKDIAAVAHWPAVGYPMIDGDRAIQLSRAMVTGNFFAVLGVRPALGRLMTSADDYPDGQDASKTRHSNIVLSYRAWREKFGGDSSVIGKHLTDGYLRTDVQIIGVAPPGFDYPANADFWTPMWEGWQGFTSSFAVARLAPGASVANARDEYLAIERRVEPQFDFKGAHAATFTETVLGNVRPVLALLSAAVGLLLLIACLNVGNLLLLRASSRYREIAVRRALGASLTDIVLQLLVEALGLAIVGGAVGFGVAVTLIDLLVAYAPANLPRLDDVQLAGAPIWLAGLVTTASVLVFGIGPAIVAARTNLASPLRLDSRSGVETRRRRAIRQSLVATQVALATIMLGGATLLARSLARLEHQDVGFTGDHVSIANFTWNVQKSRTDTSVVMLGDQLVRRVEAIPGVSAATEIEATPLLGKGVFVMKPQIEGQTDDEAQKGPSFNFESVGADYFKTFNVRIDRGRAFTDADRIGAPLVAIVSDGVARRLWPGQDPIGKRIRTGADSLLEGGWRTVVGVAHETRLRSLRESSPTIYLAAPQFFWQGSIAVRSSVPLASLLPALRAAGTDVDPDLRLWSSRTMDDVVSGPLSEPRLGTVLMSSFGVVALLLAAIGLYGVMASLVRDETRDIGIRIALGAPAWVVRRTVLGRAAVVTGVGAVVGLGLALGLSRLVTSLLFQTSPTDPVALGGACLVLFGVGAFAAYLPARRATRIDPVQALRAD
jgi:predicted permease